MSPGLARIALLLALAGTLGIVGGCAQRARRIQRTGHLVDSAQAFSHALRWKRYRICDRFVAPELKASFHDRFAESDDDLRVTDAEIVGVDWPPEATAATVRLRLRWVRLPSLTEHVTTLEQTWEDRLNGWLLARMVGPASPGSGPLDLL